MIIKRGSCKKCNVSIPSTDCNEKSVLQGHCVPCWDADDSIPSLFDLYTEEEMGYHDANALQKFRDAVRGYK